MKKVFLIGTMFYIFNSCISFRTCSLEKIEGRYYCYNNENAINWIDIHKDGTFEHYYKGKDVKLSHSGLWKKDKKNSCVIELTKWRNFNEKGANFEQYNNKYLWVTNNFYLDIGPDGESSTSFEKSDEDMSVNPLGNGSGSN